MQPAIKKKKRDSDSSTNHRVIQRFQPRWTAEKSAVLILGVNEASIREMILGEIPSTGHPVPKSNNEVCEGCKGNSFASQHMNKAISCCSSPRVQVTQVNTENVSKRKQERLVALQRSKQTGSSCFSGRNHSCEGFSTKELVARSRISALHRRQSVTELLQYSEEQQTKDFKELLGRLDEYFDAFRQCDPNLTTTSLCGVRI